MKAKKYYCLSSLIVLFVLNNQASFAIINCEYPDDTILREIIDEIQVNQSNILAIDYTTSLPAHMPTNSDQFEIFTWDKPVIKRIIIVKVDPANTKEAIDFIDNIQFSNLEPVDNTIHINLSCGARRIEASHKKWDVTMVDGKKFAMKGYNIKVVLYIPKSIELHLKSNLSKISLGDLSNNAVLDLRSVRLKANSIKELTLKATNSKIQINELTQANIEAKHCEINSSSIHQLQIRKSSFTEYNFDLVEQLDIDDSKEDTYTIKELNEIQCSHSLFSNYYINRLNKKLSITSMNGDVIIDELQPDFSEIKLNNSFSIIKIGSAKTPNFLLNTHTKLTQYYFDDGIKMIEMKEESGYRWGRYFKGSKNSSPTISIDCKQCEVHFMSGI